MDPTFECVLTDRLVLRAASVLDAGELFPITSDPNTWRHAPGGRHRDQSTTLDWLEGAASRWVGDGLGYWIARRRQDDRIVGVGGVQRQATGNWNLYYRLAFREWGHGYAVELGRAAVEAAHGTDDSVAVIAWVLPDHVASTRVAERIGLRNCGAHVDPSDGTVRSAFADRDVTAPTGKPTGTPSADR